MSLKTVQKYFMVDFISFLIFKSIFYDGFEHINEYSSLIQKDSGVQVLPFAYELFQPVCGKTNQTAQCTHDMEEIETIAMSYTAENIKHPQLDRSTLFTQF